jgi:hypothetical protein
MCMFLCFFNLSRLFFTLDRFGQQADRYIAPGGMFFYVFKYSRAPPPKNVERDIYKYVDRKNKDTFFTTKLL